MPITLRALLVVAAAVALCLAVRAVLGRFLRADRVDASQQSAGVVMEAMAGLYGVLVAFLLAGAWERFDQLRGTTSLEVNALADLRQIAQILPGPAGEEFGGIIDAYHQRALEELTLRTDGRFNDEANALVGRLWSLLASFEPGTPGQAELQSRAFEGVEELTSHRRMRLLAVRRTLPPILWLILIGGAATVLGLAAISSLGSRLPAVYLALLAAVVSLALYTIYVLSCPVRSGLIAQMAPFLESLLGQPFGRR